MRGEYNLELYRDHFSRVKTLPHMESKFYAHCSLLGTTTSTKPPCPV